ncbi:MAG: PTS sugar transporter subunit IIA [Alkalibacterium sp.]|nr:PTS sugar transporter subunit IIA [Alkalibacterium sp.]TVP90869.1 MAG: PTS sugar transporter subunit IIA [Alkalibacterium sp.]
MLSSYLKSKTQFVEGVGSWEESIELASQPLIEKDYITSSYIDEMIENVKVNGSYIVIVPEIAMPHASTDKGVLRTGMSFLKLNESVTFPGEQEVKLFFVLAANDSTTHLELLSDLSSILIEEDFRDKLKSVNSEEELISLLELVE